VKFKAVINHLYLKPALGAALTVTIGLVCLVTPMGEPLVNRSYDWLFRFGTRAVTNQVVLVEMSDGAHAALHPAGEKQWGRMVHARFLDYLRVDGCPLVVFDVLFEGNRQPDTDQALADAIRRHGRVVLLASQEDTAHPRMAGNQVLPAERMFRDASTNWGVGRAAWEADGVVRRFFFPPDPEMTLTLPWVAARLVGARLDSPTAAAGEDRWLRYYGPQGGWTRLGYQYATNQAPGYYRDKIVFIGNRPVTPVAGDEEDEFRTPYSAWTGQSAGGMEIMATTFLNLMNRDWLRRVPWWQEALVLTLLGTVLGAGLAACRWQIALTLGLGAAFTAGMTGVCMGHFTNWWYPWLVVAGAQTPCALAWAIVCRWERSGVSVYSVFPKPFGMGAYGEVFLARHKVTGEWCALKKIHRAKFNTPEAYEREFRGLTQYLPISGSHPGLLQIRHLERDEHEGYFYYVMELGDACSAGWEKDPALYKPRDLAYVRSQAEKNRLPVKDCAAIGLVLAESLEFLHHQKLIHRDIKPSNIIFVKGQPKFADVGLLAPIPQRDEGTWIGTHGYMPPLPEQPGTVLADIYALGMVLYVIATGGSPTRSLDLSETRVMEPEFMQLNRVICKACHPDLAERYKTARELREALKELQTSWAEEAPTRLA
jgi:CHASE2 domain-containing sensor protein